MKFFSWLLIFLIVLSFVASSPVRASSRSVMEDSWSDRVGDWFATVGRSQEEKDQILVERRSHRVAERTRNIIHRSTRDVQESFKSTSHSTNQSVNNMNKTLNDQMKKWK